MDGRFDGRVFGARSGAADEATLALYRADPRRAVTEDRIVCLVCGVAFRQLTNTHVATHGMTPFHYKRTYGYNLRRPLMCHALRRLYSARAVRVRLADRIRRRPIIADPELRRRAGARALPLEEILTRRDIQRRPRHRWTTRDPRGRFLARTAQG